MQRLSTYRIARNGEDLEDLGGRIFNPLFKKKNETIVNISHGKRTCMAGFFSFNPLFRKMMKQL